MRRQRRGFSVFTPMVGTIIILITMLIVSSIIQSERVAVQGSVKSYRSSELVGIAAEAQSRVVEEVRSAITSRLEDFSGDEPVMSVVVNDCPEKTVEGPFYPDPMCNGEPCPCDDAGTDCTKEETCWANTFNQVNLTATNELTSKALLESSIQHTLAGIVGKYELIKVEAYDVEFGNIVKSIGFLDCGADSCGDGRLEVQIDFAPVAGQPIAEVSSEGKRLQVFMPAEQRTYTTREPYMQYAKLTADLFNGFQLLNESWQRAGNDNSHDPAYARTDGTEWYHYNYAMQERYFGGVGRNDFASGWAPGFSADNDAATAFDNSESLGDYITSDLLTNPWFTAPGAWLPTDKDIYEDIQNFRFDSDFDGDSYWSTLEPFISGYAAVGVATGYPTLGISTDYRATTLLPGGCAEVDPAGCVRSGVDSCIASDSAFTAAVPYASTTTLLNTSGDYDARFTDQNGMKKLVKDMRDGMKSVIVAGFGLSEVEYNLTVESKQYYVEGIGFRGKDNWHCGQFLALYQSDVAVESEKAGYASTCEATRGIWGGDEPYPVCDSAGCRNFCTGNCPWFVSEPMDWTCDAKTLYRVEEIYRLYRNEPGSDEPARPVFAAKYTRIKDDYAGIGAGEHNNTLWTEYYRYGDVTTKDGITESWEREVNNVRHCVYSYNTNAPADVVPECDWVRADQLIP